MNRPNVAKLKEDTYSRIRNKTATKNVKNNYLEKCQVSASGPEFQKSKTFTYSFVPHSWVCILVVALAHSVDPLNFYSAVPRKTDAFFLKESTSLNAPSL